ncbi:MAG: HD-GYP domain-containing protein [Gemmatimonadaceae bacterium]|nr:HD-GYP domain-containing protein [Gemmatimonadaceae bacterium]
MSKIKIYVSVVAALSAALAAIVVELAPHVAREEAQAAISFAGLGILFQLVGYRKARRDADGSIAFLPFLAAIVLSPNWISLVAIGAAMAVCELFGRRAPIKGAFNISTAVLSAAITTLIYQSLGGVSILNYTSSSILAVAAALPVFLVVNTVAAYGAVAISTGTSFWTLIAAHNPTEILYDLLVLPFVFVFAWFYAEFGPVGVAMLAIPLFGVRELYKMNAQLQRTNRELLDLMVAAIEARDPYTSGHSRRVAANTRVIAEMLGLGRKEIERIYVAALLHDVGKIHEVFGPILSKPGKLSADEFAIMKTHSGLGAELIQRLTDLQDCVLPVLHHHENWDGTGYPHGIAGERIPLWSRIIMFADTADAMMSDRPYRNALSPAQVRAEFMRLKGKQFDPYVCEILLESPAFEQLFVNAPPRDASSAGTVATPSRAVSLVVN